MVKIIIKYFQQIKSWFSEWIFKMLEWEKSIVLSGKSIKNFKSLKYYIFVIKHCFFLVFVARVECEDEKIFKKEESIEIIKNSWFN